MDFVEEKNPEEHSRDLLRGSVRIFEDILFLYEKEIFRHISRFVSRKQDAEDLTQETFLKAYRSIGSFDPAKNARAWLYKIATNGVYDWLRKTRKNPELFVIDDAEYPFETIDAKNSYIYESSASAKDVEKALESIKPAHQTILLLFYEEGLRYEEIAEALSLPLNTVKTNLRRAKAAFAAEFQKNNG